jgi:RNA polymerase sigma factor (sigma-70 family)
MSDRRYWPLTEHDLARLEAERQFIGDIAACPPYSQALRFVRAPGLTTPAYRKHHDRCRHCQARARSLRAALAIEAPPLPRAPAPSSGRSLRHVPSAHGLLMPPSASVPLAAQTASSSAALSQERLLQCIDQLPKKDRLLIKAYLDGMSMSALCRRMGVTRDRARAILQRSLRKLRDAAQDLVAPRDPE